MHRYQLIAMRLSVMLIWFVACIVGPCGRVIAEDMGNPESALQSQHDPALERRASVICGPNSLYLILRLYGIPVEPETIEQYIPSHPEGMSLAELRDACGTLGVPLQLRQCSILELSKDFRSPVIAYTNSMSGDGHYTIVVAMDGDSIYLIDGSIGRVYETTPQRLANIWRGYILVPRRGGANSILASGISVLLWLIAAYAILRVTPRVRKVMCNSTAFDVDTITYNAKE